VLIWCLSLYHANFPLCYYLENVGHGNILVANFDVLGCRFYDLWAEDLSIDFETSTHGWLICSFEPSPRFPAPFSMVLQSR